MSPILFVVLFCSTRTAYAIEPGEEPFKFAHPGITYQRITPDLSVRPDETRQESNSARLDSEQPSTSDFRPDQPAHTVTALQPDSQDSFTAKPDHSEKPGHSKSQHPVQIDRSANPVSPREKPFPHERSVNKSQSVQRDHAVLSGPVYQDQRVQLASNTTVNETVPELNTRPLTEDELKELIKKNNVFEEEKNKKRQADWRQWEQDRHYGRFVPNSLSNSDPVKTITRAPSPSWREQMLWRQKHPRRYSSYDKKRRIYYYPEVIRVTSDFVLPTEFTPVSVSGKTYYYSDGNFYERQDRTFTSTAPPLGALVTTLPGGAAAVTIAGMPLHTFNGVYYKKKTAGYEVVPPPDSFDGVLIETASLTVNGEEAITVSLPDPEMPDRLVEIKLVRFGDKGFRGPQGESYSEFPSIEQLREMYL